VVYRRAAAGRTALPEPHLRRLASRIAWPLRKGKLLKSLFTFEGGFDYIAWKL
jgi:hypothetical protein